MAKAETGRSTTESTEDTEECGKTTVFLRDLRVSRGERLFDVAVARNISFDAAHVCWHSGRRDDARADFVYVQGRCRAEDCVGEASLLFEAN
jgi:hypothetical protein